MEGPRGLLVRRGVYGLPRFAKSGFPQPFARSHADQRVLAFVTEDLSVIADDFVSVLSGFLGHGIAFDAICHANITGLSTSTTFAGLFRAIYEGLGFAARDCYGVMGSIPDEIRITGGAARSLTLLQIFADILGAPVRQVMREETGAAGAAMIAAISLGRYSGLAACAEAWVSPTLGTVTEPDPRLREFYSKLFPIYLLVREAMPPVWAALAQAREVNP